MKSNAGKLLIAIFLAFSSCALFGQEALDQQLREAIFKVDVEVADMYGKTATKPLVITVFRPPGEVRSPLLILNHGRAMEAKRHLQGRQRYLEQARFFVAKGFVVVVPTRIGYGETYGGVDPEWSNACQDAQLAPKDEAIYKQVLAAYNFAKSLDYVEPAKWVIAGQSLGGYTTVVVTRRAPAGLVGGINFAGGYGGDPEKRRGNSCGSAAWDLSLKKKTDAAAVPMVWIYWKDDRYWGNSVPKEWFKSFQAGGGVGEFHHLPEIKGDGHSGFTRDFQAWAPVVDKFLNSLPLKLNEVSIKPPMKSPPATDFAKIGEVDKVPYLKPAAREAYKNFIATKESPRAFAINSDGKWAFSNDYSDAMQRALDRCNMNARNPCALYVVDEDVVWKRFND